MALSLLTAGSQHCHCAVTAASMQTELPGAVLGLLAPPLPQHSHLSTGRAAELPVAVLARAFGHLLLQTHGNSWEVFGQATAWLAQAVRLATVSRHWRQAVIIAAQDMPDPRHHLFKPTSRTPAHYLSPLLAQLVHGRDVHLDHPLLAAPTVASFLNLARTSTLQASVYQPRAPPDPETTRALLGNTFSRCTSLRKLHISGFVPSAFPPSLWVLSVHKESRLQLEQLSGLECLPDLTGLSLAWSGSNVSLEGQWLHLPALQQVTVKVCSYDMTVCQLAPLAEAAAQGIRIVLDVVLTKLVIWPVLASGAAALPAVDELHVLCANASDIWAVHTPVTPLRCKELTLRVSNNKVTDWVLHRVQYNTVCFFLDDPHCSWPGVFEWTFLAARQGPIVVDLAEIEVFGCPGTLPERAGGWSMVLLQPRFRYSRGLPLNLFVPGPRGHLVWRSSCVSDAGLTRALDKLDQLKSA